MLALTKECRMLNKVIDYKIISSSDAGSLESSVKDFLRDGWTPSGPIFDYKDDLNQAMVKFGR